VIKVLPNDTYQLVPRDNGWGIQYHCSRFTAKKGATGSQEDPPFDKENSLTDEEDNITSDEDANIRETARQ